MTGTEAPKGEGQTIGISALVALVFASLPMNLDPAIHNIAVVSAGNDLRMTGAERALAASIGTLCIAATILGTGSLGDRLGRKKIMLAGLAVALAGHPPVGDEFGARRVRHIDDLHTVTVIADRTFHADEAVVRRGIEIGILSAVVKAAVRA